MNSKHKKLARQGLDLAQYTNKLLISNIERRASPRGAVLHACLNSYRSWRDQNPESDPLENLTHHLVSTVSETLTSIRTRMSAKWEGEEGEADKIASSVTNSMRRSAGTNYQALVSYAIARHLLQEQSQWYVVHPVPVKWGQSLAIKFGVPPAAPDDVDTVGADVEQLPLDEVLVEVEAPNDDVVVKPDLDILLRNAGWSPESEEAEPVLVLSVKTSLADRAGSAARWKTYFDLVTRPCQHACEATCAYRRLGIELANTPNIEITHGIVTANIYKMTSDPYFAKYGELRTNQARSNTFMFDLRFTTRDDTSDVMAEGWSSLSKLREWLKSTSTKHDLPV